MTILRWLPGLLGAALLCASCAGTRGRTPVDLAGGIRTELDRVLDDFETAANTVQPELAEKHLLLDDPRFTEIEDFIPTPIGAEKVRWLHDWARKNGKPGEHVRFRERRYYRLTADAAYATAIQHLSFEKPSRSRVTFVFLLLNGAWKVIHAHYSTTPKKEE